MAPTKVLLLVTLSEIGGAQKVVYHIASGLAAEEFDVTVACSPGGELVSWLRGLPSVRVVELGSLRRDISPFHDFLCLVQLYRLISSGGYDIVHCHSSKAGVLGRLAARMAGVRKIFFTVHGWGIDDRQPLPARFLYTTAERLAGAVSTRVVCVSEHDREKGVALGLVSPEKLAVVHNGVPDVYGQGSLPPGGPPAGTGLRAELGLGSGDIVVGTVMRLAPPKDPLFFLEAADRLLGKGNNSNLYFVIVGDGPLRPCCEEYIAGSNLEGRAFLLGTREDAPGLVSGFDIFTLFSRHEGLPLTVIEAMVAGLPVVASNVGGVGELVLHGETGCLADGFNPEAAAGYIGRLAGDRGLREELGRAGRSRALDRFGLGRMISLYKQIYLGSLLA